MAGRHRPGVQPDAVSRLFVPPLGSAVPRRPKNAPPVLAPLVAVAAVVLLSTVDDSAATSGLDSYGRDGSGPPVAPVSGPGVAAAYPDLMLDLTNAERRDRGCPDLEVEPALTAAAQAHSADMARRGFFDHVDPSGRGPDSRVRASGYRWLELAENIAAGQRTPADVVTGWMRSPAHRVNLLDCSLREIGVGYSADPGSPYGTYWVQELAAPG